MANFHEELSKYQLPKPKIFEIPLKNVATLGISPNLTKQAHPLNGKMFVSLLIFGCAISCTFVFILHDATTFAEYVQSIFACSFATFAILCLLTTMLQAEILFAYIGHCDKASNTSKLVQSIFFSLNIIKYLDSIIIFSKF